MRSLFIVSPLIFSRLIFPPLAIFNFGFTLLFRSSSVIYFPLTTHFTTLLFPPSDTRSYSKGSCLESVLSHHLFRVLLIYSCHFLILIIERREMFLSYG